MRGLDVNLPELTTDLYMVTLVKDKMLRGKNQVERVIQSSVLSHLMYMYK